MKRTDTTSRLHPLPGDELRLLSSAGGTLRTERRFDWPEPIVQAVHRILLEDSSTALPRVVALVGGASSGKSTIFNNLLDGHLASRIAARGHTTFGLILAVHDDDLEQLTHLLTERRLFPELGQATAGLDGDVAGSPDTVTVVRHSVSDLRGVLLLDTPDFTSDAARREGDLTLSLLPWFDQLLVVIDHERWFDRQAFGPLRDASAQFGQRRLVLFNRSREESMGAEDTNALRERAERLGADDMVVLEFRRGRGFCRFPPDVLDGVRTWLRGSLDSRRSSLLTQIARAAEHVLNQNDERRHRLTQMREAVEGAVARTTPSQWDTLTALLTPEERTQFDVVARVLRVRQASAWLGDQGRRLRSALAALPGIGSLWTTTRGPDRPPQPSHRSRAELAANHAGEVLRRVETELRRVHASSSFWSEIRRWSGTEPPPLEFESAGDHADRLREAATEFDRAVATWTQKVDKECSNVGANLQGALGVGAIGLAAVLIAVPGPLAVLSLAAAKGAVAGALGHLAAASGAGFLLGRPLGRLASVVQEKLVGSTELNAVRTAAEAIQRLIAAEIADRKDQVLVLAESMVLAEGDPLHAALESVQRIGASGHD
ncbi:MAG: GTPase domain-containing protein [Phycisphaerae bacterium]|nr:GTPase domain-containing protein [Phycisphaerae bacterium]